MLKEKLQQDLKSAMIARDIVSLETIRMVKKYVQELETSPGHSGTATDDEILKVIQKMVKQGKDAAEQFKSAGRTDLVEGEMNQVKVLEKYLPKQMSDDEIAVEIDNVMKETGLTAMGPLMKELNIRLAGRADGKTISNVLKTKLH